MKQVGNTILAKGVNHILAKRDNSAWPKGAKLSGFSNYTAFAVRITIICDRTSTQTGYVCGRNTFVKNSSGGNAMDSNYYPYRMNNNAGNETGKWNMAAGDIREFLLVWDGSSGYYAYLLNIRE